MNGHGYDMVVHLVHADAEGHLAVVAVFLKKGNANPSIDSVWQNLPPEKEKAADVSGKSHRVLHYVPGHSLRTRRRGKRTGKRVVPMVSRKQVFRVESHSVQVAKRNLPSTLGAPKRPTCQLLNSTTIPSRSTSSITVTPLMCFRTLQRLCGCAMFPLLFIRRLGVVCIMLIAVIASAQQTPPHWSYSGHGSPDEWGKLDSTYAAWEKSRKNTTATAGVFLASQPTCLSRVCSDLPHQVLGCWVLRPSALGFLY